VVEGGRILGRAWWHQCQCQQAWRCGGAASLMGETPPHLPPVLCRLMVQA